MLPGACPGNPFPLIGANCDTVWLLRSLKPTWAHGVRSVPGFAVPCTRPGSPTGANGSRNDTAWRGTLGKDPGRRAHGGAPQSSNGASVSHYVHSRRGDYPTPRFRDGVPPGSSGLGGLCRYAPIPCGSRCPVPGGCGLSGRWVAGDTGSGSSHTLSAGPIPTAGDATGSATELHSTGELWSADGSSATTASPHRLSAGSTPGAARATARPWCPG